MCIASLRLWVLNAVPASLAATAVLMCCVRNRRHALRTVLSGAGARRVERGVDLQAGLQHNRLVGPCSESQLEWPA